MESNDGSLRRRDFYTGILLILLALAVIREATTYPMSDSYGGVQNVWYVSPALFPILVGLLLLILALVLTGNAIACLGWPAVLRDKEGSRESSGSSNLRFISVVLFFCAFVYIYVPRVDFFIAGVFFLYSFIGGFYLDRSRALVLNSFYYCVIAAAILLSTETGAVQSGHWIADGITTIGLLSLFLISLKAFEQDADCRRKLRITLLVALLVPLILTPIFKFGLLVPLPTEGIYIEWMEQLRYLLRSLVQAG